jgi:endonuclease/exonuclease/phosphatase (EEP) superfamily protein YafD
LRLTFVAAAVLIFISYPVAQLYLGRNPTSEAKDGTKVRLLQMNIWGGKNRAYDKVIDEIRSEDADLIGITEITPGWYERLKPELKEFRYSIVDTQHGGIALFSKFPLTGKVNYFGTILRPRIDAQVEIGGRRVAIIFAHPVIPLKSFDLRNSELLLLSQEARDRSVNGPCILAGDLNCTPWSVYFEKLLSDSQMIDTEKGFGPQPSWSTQMKLPPLFPIDHCLVSPDIYCLSRRLGKRTGSDHLPVIVDLFVSARS